MGFRELYAYDKPEFAGWITIRGATEIVNASKDLDTPDLEIIDQHTIRVGIAGTRISPCKVFRIFHSTHCPVIFPTH